MLFFFSHSSETEHWKLTQKWKSNKGIGILQENFIRFNNERLMSERKSNLERNFSVSRGSTRRAKKKRLVNQTKDFLLLFLVFQFLQDENAKLQVLPLILFIFHSTVA